MQVGVNWVNYFMIFCLLATYVKNTEHKPRAKLSFRLSLAVYVAWGVVGGCAITFAFLLIEGTPVMAPNTSGIYNKVLGLAGTVSIILQWSPQIVTTFLHKGPGALSPITLSINSPGSLLTAISLVAAGKSFSLWLPYVLSGAQQAVIVSLILYFYCTRGKQGPIEEILDHDPGFQGPALLLEESSSSGSDQDDNDGLVGSPSGRPRSYSDSEFGSNTTMESTEEYGEEETDQEDDQDDSNSEQQLIPSSSRRPTRRQQQQQRRAQQQQQEQETLSRSVPSSSSPFLSSRPLF